MLMASALDGPEARKLPSPPYVAVMLCAPGASDDVLKVAVPPGLTAPLPRVVVPSLKTMLRVGVPAPGAMTATVAENVNVCPGVSVPPVRTGELTVVAALLTMNGTATEVLPAKIVLPRYLALRACAPTAKFETVRLAVEVVIVPGGGGSTGVRATTESGFPLSRNCTLPSGAPLDETTLTLIVTGCPKTELPLGASAVTVVVVGPRVTTWFNAALVDRA
jgi:hypothetical protein